MEVGNSVPYLGLSFDLNYKGQGNNGFLNAKNTSIFNGLNSNERINLPNRQIYEENKDTIFNGVNFLNNNSFANKLQNTIGAAFQQFRNALSETDSLNTLIIQTQTQNIAPAVTSATGSDLDTLTVNDEPLSFNNVFLNTYYNNSNNQNDYSLIPFFQPKLYNDASIQNEQIYEEEFNSATIKQETCQNTNNSNNECRLKLSGVHTETILRKKLENFEQLTKNSKACSPKRLQESVNKYYLAAYKNNDNTLMPNKEKLQKTFKNTDFQRKHMFEKYMQESSEKFIKGEITTNEYILIIDRTAQKIWYEMAQSNHNNEDDIQNKDK